MIASSVRHCCTYCTCVYTTQSIASLVPRLLPMQRSLGTRLGIALRREEEGGEGREREGEGGGGRRKEGGGRRREKRKEEGEAIAQQKLTRTLALLLLRLMAKRPIVVGLFRKRAHTGLDEGAITCSIRVQFQNNCILLYKDKCRDTTMVSILYIQCLYFQRACNRQVCVQYTAMYIIQVHSNYTIPYK